jgi:diguanylate cyclase (GGDEF)-like protein
MGGSDRNNSADPAMLMEIIRAQTEIARLGLDLGGVMTFVTDRVQKLTGAGGAIVELVEGEEMVYRAASGMAGRQLGLRLQRNRSLSGLCVAQRRVLRCDDSQTDPRVDKDACARVGLRSMVVAPLNHGDTAVGVLKIVASHPAAFADEHAVILDLMSGLIAAAMHNAVRYQTGELYHASTHDALTGLANRALFYDRLRQALALARRQSTRLALLNLDMDGLKPINDRYGHRAGDAAIDETGRRINAISRQSDTVARVGGDEFAVIMTDIDSRESAVRHAARLADEIGRPFCFENNQLTLGASVGLASFPDQGVEMEGLIETADQAMYAVKRTRATSRVGEPS